MFFFHKKFWPLLAVAFTASTIVSIPVARAQSQVQTNTPLNNAVMSTLQTCQKNFTSCANATKNAAGELVFPSVVKADLIVGGSGGKGALVENGKITGYYNIGAASVGLQAGVENASQVYVFPDQNSLQAVKQGSYWDVGSLADITLIAANADYAGAAGNPTAFFFDSKGLHAGIDLSVFYVWKSGSPRPTYKPQTR